LVAMDSVIVNYLHAKWTPEFGKNLHDAACHWWSVVMPAVGEVQSRGAFRFLDSRLDACSPLDIAGESLTITIPEHANYVFRPDGSVTLCGYHQQSQTVAFRWDMGGGDLRTTEDWLNLPGVNRNDADNAVFLLVRLNGEHCAPATILVIEDSFTVEGLLSDIEMQQLIKSAGL